MTARLPRTVVRAKPEKRRADVRLILDRDHYDVVIDLVKQAKVSLWIATANVKELRVEASGVRMLGGARVPGTRGRASGSRRFISVLEVLERLAEDDVEVRLLHAGLPSRAFREELRRHPMLRSGGLAMRRCPRVHLKMIAVDGAQLYLGSANFTGAGLGAKGEKRRNFEAGVLTDDDVMLDAMQGVFDRIWEGVECEGCKLRDVCPAPIDTLLAARPTIPSVRPPPVKE